MTERNPIPATVVPAALSAFVRGLERRAALFAELQCGDAAVAEAAVAAALQDFVAAAAYMPMADWPRSFWATLLDVPTLRSRSGEQGQWPPPFTSLAGVGHGPRAALLLSVVARLSEADAAGVLGVAQPTYRLALQHALPRTAQGHPDVAVWDALDDAARQSLRDLPPERLRRLEHMRDAALSGDASAPVAEPSGRQPQTHPEPETRGSPPRWLSPLLWAGLGVCALAFALSFVLPDQSHNVRADAGEAIRRDPLPVAAAASQPYDEDLALLSHRDFEQLADPTDHAVSEELALYSWYAAGLASQPAQALPLPDAAQPMPETADAATAGVAAAATDKPATDTNAPR